MAFSSTVGVGAGRSVEGASVAASVVASVAASVAFSVVGSVAAGEDSSLPQPVTAASMLHARSNAANFFINDLPF